MGPINGSYNWYFLWPWLTHGMGRHWFARSKQDPRHSIRIVIWILLSVSICRHNKNISKYWDGNAVYPGLVKVTRFCCKYHINRNEIMLKLFPFFLHKIMGVSNIFATAKTNLFISFCFWALLSRVFESFVNFGTEQELRKEFEFLPSGCSLCRLGWVTTDCEWIGWTRTKLQPGYARPRPCHHSPISILKWQEN